MRRIFMVDEDVASMAYVMPEGFFCVHLTCQVLSCYDLRMEKCPNLVTISTWYDTLLSMKLGWDSPKINVF